MSSAVNRPTDVKQKEADVNRKLQFYGISTGKLQLSLRAVSWLTTAVNSFPSWQGPICKEPCAFNLSLTANILAQNEQIDVALNSFLASKALSSPPANLSTEGKALVAQFREVVSPAKYLLLTKNEGNLLQDFIWQSQKIETGNTKLPGAPVDAETAKQHGNEALEGLRTLGTLIITNGQFRKLCKFPEPLSGS